MDGEGAAVKMLEVGWRWALKDLSKNSFKTGGG